jgi:hypothetical protein
VKLPHMLTERRFRRGKLVETRVRTATSSDYYAWARDELQKARLANEILKALEGSEFATELEFLEEATRDGVQDLLEHLVYADKWREHARTARRQGL